MVKKKAKTLSKAKRECWEAFSRYIRMRDCFKTTGSTEWGLCVTCGKRYHFKMLQACHFIAGRHNGNLFSERGVHAGCYYCNITLKGNTLEYRRRIIQMYGEGSDVELETEARQIKQFKVFELEALTESFKAKIKELEQRNKIGGNIA